MFTRQDLISGSQQVTSDSILAFDGAAANASARGGAPRRWRTGMDKKNKNQNTGNARATNHSDKKNPRKKTSGKTRPDRPADQKATPDRKDHDPGRVPRRTKSNPLDELFASEEFKADLAFIAERVEESAGNDSQIGERASKWIGDHRYSRKLNTERFAEQLKRETGCERTGRQIKNYTDAYQERQLHEKSGKRFPYLDTSHLAQIASCCRDAPEEEHLELAELANRRKAGVREIPKLALGLHAERHRTNLVEVVIAAGKRLSESLRVIEETGKTLNITFSSQIESIRYRAYDLESRLQMLLGTGRARQWRLCLLLTESLCRLNWHDVVERALENGADCIQVREKNMETRALTDRVREVVSLAHPGGACVIVNDRADVALIAGADGVHVGQHDLTVAQVRRLAGRSLLVGVSTHDLDEASAAVQAGADYCGVGAMFPSSLKPERTPSGPTYLQRFIETYPDVPHLAIGGIDQGNIAQLVEAGCRGIAVSSAICAADDPKTVTQQLREAFQAVEAPS